MAQIIAILSFQSQNYLMSFGTTSNVHETSPVYVYGLTCLLLQKFIIFLDKVSPALIAHCCWFWPPDELPGVPWYPEEATSE